MYKVLPTQNLKGYTMYQAIDASHLEKHLLSLIECGCYINTQDIVELGTIIGLELPYKRRLLLLQSLFLHVKATQQESCLEKAIEHLLEQKKETLLAYAKSFPQTRLVLQPLIRKIEATKRLVHLFLHVKEPS